MEAMTRDDVMRATVAHVRRVAILMMDAVRELQERAIRHDDSKFASDEYDTFAAETPGLRSLTYGSPEYQAALDRMKPALKLHYQRNDHHPEHYANSVNGMDLVSLIEMLADWKAATERHADGSLTRSIEQNAKRFGYDDNIKAILLRTAVNLGWEASGL